MEVIGIDALAGLRAALEAPEGERMGVYVERVMEPLRPFWESGLRFFPGAKDLAADPVAAARTFTYYTPEQDAAAGLEALDVLDRAGTQAACIQAIHRALDALRPEEHGIDYDRIAGTVLLMDPARFAMRGGGYSGVGMVPGQVSVMVWPSEFNVPRLPGAMAHEVHHNVRLQHEPWTPMTSVGQYMVLEGMAEAFAGELYGHDLIGPWATTIDAEQVTQLRPRLKEALEVTGFNEIRGYIFGDWAAQTSGYTAQGLPDFAGYGMGYRVVMAYLERTGRTAAEATYTPWREVVEESRFFEGP
jgi:uncharacterized protein YjaZ